MAMPASVAKVATAMAAGIAIVAAATTCAMPAQAKDWSASFPSGKDVPKSLGTYDAKPFVDASSAPKGGWYPCAAFTVPAASTVVDGSYSPHSRTEKLLDARAYVYASAAKAEAAFARLSAKLSTCDGKANSKFGESGPNTMRTTTTTGTLDDLTITGVPSVYVYGRTVPLPGAGHPAVNSGGSYDVYTLVNDTILMMTASQAGQAGYTPEQQAAVVDFASAFEESWALAND